MSYTIFTSNPAALIPQPGRAVNTYPSGLVRVDQTYLGRTDYAESHRATLAVGNEMPDGDSSPCIDGLFIFPEVQERRREDGFTEFVVSAYGRSNAFGRTTRTYSRIVTVWTAPFNPSGGGFTQWHTFRAVVKFPRTILDESASSVADPIDTNLPATIPVPIIEIERTEVSTSDSPFNFSQYLSHLTFKKLGGLRLYEFEVTAVADSDIYDAPAGTRLRINDIGNWQLKTQTEFATSESVRNFGDWNEAAFTLSLTPPANISE